MFLFMTNDVSPQPESPTNCIAILSGPIRDMCGIYAVIASTQASRPSTSDLLTSRLVNRGPDHLGIHNVTYDASPESVHLSFLSTVLALRGSAIVEQPLVSEDGERVLCWNGEAWRMNGEPVTSNDGQQILQALAEASSSENAVEEVARVIRLVEGPFAFVFFDKQHGRLLFGRDRLGRRSLLVHRSETAIRLSSIADEPHEGWEEVEADGFYSVDLKGTMAQLIASITRHPWDKDDNLVSSIGLFNKQLPLLGILPLTRESPSVQQLHEHLVSSLQCRVLDIPRPPECGENDARLAVLFSGGLDCTMLARLVDGILPREQPVDLLNVAFENPRLKAQHKDKELSPEELCEMCPDRQTGRASFAELATVCPGRAWRFVAVNVPYDETLSNKAEVVKLIYPHQTEMDLSIAYALYFASRGSGFAQTTPEGYAEPYQTKARVLLSGLGADELFGGYTRHITAFSRRSHAGLAEELELDVSRLGKRNLGRDDRVLSHWGREVRFPFLDEDLVRWAMEVPVTDKCDFENVGTAEHPEPAKRVLRLLAQKLGMAAVAMEKKRAIQFGARTAKMESGRTKGTTLITA